MLDSDCGRAESPDGPGSRRVPQIVMLVDPAPLAQFHDALYRASCIWIRAFHFYFILFVFQTALNNRLCHKERTSYMHLRTL